MLITERGLGGDSVDLERRLMRFHLNAASCDCCKRAGGGGTARQAGNGRSNGGEASPGERDAPPLHPLLWRILKEGDRSSSTLWPDRVAKARGEARAASCSQMAAARSLDAADPLAGEAFLRRRRPAGQGAERAHRLGRRRLEDDVRTRARLSRSRPARSTPSIRQKRSVRVRETARLGAIVLSERMPAPPSGALKADKAILAALREHGLSLLNWSKEAETLRQRLSWLHRGPGASGRMSPTRR